VASIFKLLILVSLRILYTVIMVRKKDDLAEEDVRAAYGSLYQGVKVLAEKL